jgi:hypothetical protein
MTEFAFSPFILSDMAGCFSPDSSTSSGAEFLTNIQDAVNDHDSNDNEFDSDIVSEIADSIVPTYTHELWTTFVDLGAYTENVSIDNSDGDSRAKVALYIIAERLLNSLIQEM